MDEINEEEPTEPTEPTDATSAEDSNTESSSAEDSATEEMPSADVAMDDDVTMQDMAADDDPPEEPPAPAAPGAIPPPYYPTQDTRLTRDPFATFGGVLSGIAHRYGWDVALTRLAFVVLLIVSGGTAIIAYLAAWLIIPRASNWPPARVSTTRTRLSGRDLGIGLIALGALIVLAIGSGEAAAVLVPLALVGGGIWLLIQNPRDAEVEAKERGPADAPVMPARPVMAPSMPPSQPMMAPQPPFAPQPVPKRSWLRRFGIIGLFSFLGLLLLAIIAVPLIFLAVITDGDFDTDREYVFRPTRIEEIPTDVSEDIGEIRLDLRGVDFSSITTDDDPIRVDVELDLGRIEVLLPEEVRVVVDAEADLGDVTVFGSNDDGYKPSRSIEQDDPQLDLELDVNAGEIVVRRGSSFSVTTVEVG